MTAKWRASTAGLVICLALAASAAARQDQAEPKAAEDEQAKTTPLQATVVEVVGDVKTAPVGTSPLAAKAWKPVKANDKLSAGTLIRTGLRSRLILQFGDDTIISVKRVTLASIDAFYKTKTTKTARLGLGYGAVRGGSTEGRLRSDLVIDSTVATLAKRGTEGFEMTVEPYTGRFAISLAREGLIEALQKATSQRRLVRPGEYANEMNIAKMWIRQDQFDRNVRFFAAESVTTADLDFSVANTTGYGSIAPGAGNQALNLAGRAEREFIADQVIQQMRRPPIGPGLRLPDLVVIEQGPVRRPEGDFGVADTVRILVPEFDLGRQMRSFFGSRPTQRDVDRWTRRPTRRRSRS